MRVSALGDSAPLCYDDEALRPPRRDPRRGDAAALAGRHSLASASVKPIQSSALPPVQVRRNPSAYADAALSERRTIVPHERKPVNRCRSIRRDCRRPNDDDDIGIPGGPPHPYYGGPGAPADSPRAGVRRAADHLPPLAGRRERAPMVTASAGPVEVQPPATLACPIVSALDQWISSAVQPAALHWFRQPVVEIKQISAYSCRGMNGDPNAHISEHAFGNALDVAEFDLADGHKISVQYGWHGTPEEQGFLHDVQSAACDEFTTVLAPGANVYHYNHIHVDLMRHSNGRHICEPSAIPGEVAAAHARSQFAAQHSGGRYGERSNDPGVTGSITKRTSKSVRAMPPKMTTACRTPCRGMTNPSAGALHLPSSMLLQHRRGRPAIDLEPVALLIIAERGAGQHAGFAVDLVVVIAARGEDLLHAVEIGGRQLRDLAPWRLERAVSAVRSAIRSPRWPTNKT